MFIHFGSELIGFQDVDGPDGGAIGQDLPKLRIEDGQFAVDRGFDEQLLKRARLRDRFRCILSTDSSEAEIRAVMELESVSLFLIKSSRSWRLRS